jgi:hypothetical protein
MGSFEFGNLKEDSRISKELLSNVISGATQKTIPTDRVTVVYSCDNCPYKGLPKDKFESNCNEFCIFREAVEEVRIPEIGYTNKRMTNSIGEEVSISMPYVIYTGINKALPKIAIKVLLLYHFCNRNQFNIVKRVSLTDVAKELDISVASVKRSNELLQSLNFIHAIEVWHNTYDIAITGIDKLHFKKEEDGKGYLTMSKENLKKLVEIKNVNELRAEIQKILNADYYASQKKVIAEMKIDTVKKVLPFYLSRGRKAVEDILRSENTMFNVVNIDYKRNIVEMDISKYERRDQLRSNLEQSIYTELGQFIKDHNICIVSETETTLNPDEPVGVEYLINIIESGSTDKERYENRLKNLVELAIEYGTHNIKNMLLYIQRRYIVGEGIAIRNLGGFIRMKMLTHISTLGSCVGIAV